MKPDIDYDIGVYAGDEIRTSYGSGGVVKSVNGPWWWENGVGTILVRTWPVWGFALVQTGWINDIRKDWGGLYSDSNDRVYVTRANPKGKFAPPALDQPSNFPWDFRPNVDYHHNVWHCENCGDFNAAPEDEKLRLRWHCIYCGKYRCKKLLLMQERQKGLRLPNSYITALGGYSYLEQMERAEKNDWVEKKTRKQRRGYGCDDPTAGPIRYTPGVQSWVVLDSKDPYRKNR